MRPAGLVALRGISSCNVCAIPLYSLFPRVRPCYRSSMAEHWFCKPDVVGSTPTGSFPRRKRGRWRDAAGRKQPPNNGRDGHSPDQGGSGKQRGVAGMTSRVTEYGQMAERPMAPDCKSGGLRPTQVRILLCPVFATIGSAGVAQWQSACLPSKPLGVRFSSPA